MERFVAFDVETPNYYNDRMSSIGIAVIENGEIVDSFPEMVERAPSFPELWREIAPLMTSGILAAHNAAFDLRVLSRCLMDYEMNDPRFAKYLCTVTMGRKCYPSLPNHKLDTLCSCRGIALDHHRADSDSLACASLLLDYMAQGMRPDPFVRTYDFWTARTLKKQG